MMINHIWTVLCLKSVIDQDTNNISLVDVFERLEVGVPKEAKDIKVPIRFEVISLWKKTEKDKTEVGDMKLEVLDPEGKGLGNFNFKVEFKPELIRMRSRLRMEGLKLTVSGDYIFRIKTKESTEGDYKTVAEIPLEVHILRGLHNKFKKVIS